MAAKKKEAIEETGASIGGPQPWVYVLFLLLVYWGINYLDGHSGGFNATVYAPHKNATAVASLKVQKSPEELAVEGGGRVYRAICAACHQPNGGFLPAKSKCLMWAFNDIKYPSFVPVRT